MLEHRNDHSAPRGSVIINAQYVKDLSFESPRPLHALLANEQPLIDIALDVNAQLVHDSTFEVMLHVQVKATVKNEVAFMVELQYGGLFSVDEKTTLDTDREIVLLVHCPNILFPYARRIISDITRDGGYPPLMIAPVDFMGLYYQRKNATKNKESRTEENTIN
ncbi:Protein-export protein SecB [Alphaproteobacteria bacterium]